MTAKFRYRGLVQNPKSRQTSIAKENRSDKTAE